MKSEKGLIHLLIAGEVIVLIAVILLGVVKQVTGPAEETEIEMSTQKNETEELSDATEQVTESGPENTEEDTATVIFSEEIEAMLEEMSMEEKVAQLFIVSPETLTGTDRVTIAGEGTRSALMEYPVGGILYTRQNYLGQTQMRDLIQGAQTMSNEQSGRYLFAGTLVEIGEETVIANVWAGQEEALAGLVAADNPQENADVEDMEHILYVQEIEEIPQERNAETLYCYNVTGGGQTAVEAINNGADMLCVTEGFTSVYEFVLEAANEGEIPETAIEQAVGRVLTRKQALSQ